MERFRDGERERQREVEVIRPLCKDGVKEKQEESVKTMEGGSAEEQNDSHRGSGGTDVRTLKKQPRE